MSGLRDAVEWIAMNDAAGDTPEGLNYIDAMDQVEPMITVALVADMHGKTTCEIAHAVLKVRGFKKPRNWKDEQP